MIDADESRELERNALGSAAVRPAVRDHDILIEVIRRDVEQFQAVLERCLNHYNGVARVVDRFDMQRAGVQRELIVDVTHRDGHVRRLLD